MSKTQNGRLTLVMRLAEERDIVSFELRAGETLSQRVKEEIKTAAADGRLKGLASRAGLPVAAVRESNEDGNGINSIALFTGDGEEVTNRSTMLDMEDELYLLKGVEEEKETLIGAFPNQDTAERVGCLWKAGLI